MIERIKFIQENKVDELLALTNVEGEKEYTLKAPTGSGKTYMEGYLISKLLSQYPNAIVIYQSLSKAGLASQAYEKIVNQYQFNNINAYLINTDYSDQERPSVSLNYNTYFLPKDLFKKGGNIEIAFKNFLTYENRDKQKFLILDEGHIASNNIGKYKDEFDQIFIFTATPSKEQMLPGRFVELEEDECIRENIIKSKKEIHQEELEQPLNKRLITTLQDWKKIKEQYKGSGINPCLIIQISNKFKGENEKNVVIEHLNRQGMLWYYDDAKGLESSDRINELKGEKSKEIARKYVVSPTSNVEVVIFKLAITEGFDIPRACYLFQIRSTQSETLDEQVVGRIRRNPSLTNFDNWSDKQKEELMIAYVNGVVKQKTRNVKFVQRKEALTFKTTTLINKVPKTLNIKKFNLTKYDKSPMNIFELRDKWNLLDGRVKNAIIDNHGGDLTKEEWIKYCLNVDILNKKPFLEDYQDNLKISETDVEIQQKAFYREDENYIIYVNEWLWEHIDNKSNRYDMESDAEKIIGNELANSLDLKKWGRNWYNGSKISYEYFLNQKGIISISKQHPDFFIVKNNKKYLLEVKSYISSNNFKFNTDDYKSKVESIKKLYQEASKVTNQVFVVMLQNIPPNRKWTSFVYENGKLHEFYDENKFNFLNH